MPVCFARDARFTEFGVVSPSLFVLAAKFDECFGVPQDLSTETNLCGQEVTAADAERSLTPPFAHRRRKCTRIT